MAASVKANGSGEQQVSERKPPPFVIPRNACELAEAARNTWEISLPVGTTPEALLKELDALGPIAKDLRLKDLIYAQPRDAAWLAIYRVLAIDVTRVQLALLQQFTLPARVDHGDADPVGYKITRDDVHGWFILRLADGVTMSTQRNNRDLKSWEMCRRFIADHPTNRQ